MSALVVFLDIDGVLNSRFWYERRTDEERVPRSELGEIDPDAAARVNQLCIETGAKVVISSTWRLLHKMPDLRGILRAKGIAATILGRTPALNTERGHEIQKWIDGYATLGGDPLTGMVILDDDSDMVHLTPWLVKTSFADGFTSGDIHRAKLVLQRPAAEARP